MITVNPSRTCGHRLVNDSHVVIGEGTRCFYAVFTLDGHAVKENVCGRIARGLLVGKDIKTPAGHEATTGGAIQVPHILEGFPEDTEILVRNTSVLREKWTEEAMRSVKAVRDQRLAPHGAGAGLFVVSGVWLIAAVLQSHSGN